MGKKRYQNLQIQGRTFGPPLSGEGGPIDLRAIAVWKQAPITFATIELDLGFGPIIFEADWKNCAENTIKEIKEDFSQSQEELSLEKRIKNKTTEVINSTVNVKVIYPIGFRGLSDYLVEVYLTFTFLALNLAAPGSAEFWKLNIISKEPDHEDFDFSSVLLHAGWQKSLELDWPPISQLDLGKVVEWLCTNNLFKDQIAHSRTQRVVYAILNLCHQEEPEPSQVIWLAHALEALVDSPSENIGKYLKERLFLLTGHPNRSVKEIKKLIDEFYNLRSRIVHGNFNICHPTGSELIDKNVFNYHSDFMDPLDFASAIVISALQKIILNNWSEVCFEETMKPKLI